MTEETAFAWRESAIKLQAELDRLRSDEWLERAAEEASEDWIVRQESLPQAARQLLAIFRKHRDGDK